MKAVGSYSIAEPGALYAGEGGDTMHDPLRVLSEANRELARLPSLLTLMLGELDALTARTRPAPAEWAPIEILCHLRDEETEDFGARLRAVLDGRKEFVPIDPERWVEERGYR